MYVSQWASDTQDLEASCIEADEYEVNDCAYSRFSNITTNIRRPPLIRNTSVVPKHLLVSLKSFQRCIMTSESHNQRSKENQGFSFKRLSPLIILGMGLALFFIFDLDAYITQETLRNNRDWLLSCISENTVLTTLVFMTVYAVGTAFALPVGAILTITGGFMFGQISGTLYVVSAATIGSTCLFLAAKTGLGDVLRTKAGPAVKSMEKGFRENELIYMFVLRLIPIFPFFIVNLVPAFLGVSLRNYVIGTFFGIIPGSFIYLTIGAGIGTIFDQGKILEISSVLTKEIVSALIGLAVLALLPVAYKKFKAGKGTE